MNTLEIPAIYQFTLFFFWKRDTTCVIHLHNTGTTSDAIVLCSSVNVLQANNFNTSVAQTEEDGRVHVKQDCFLIWNDSCSVQNSLKQCNSDFFPLDIRQKVPKLKILNELKKPI